MPEAAFYGLYAWCLNPLLSLAELCARLQEELARYEDLRIGWQAEECRINLYLFVCAIACTVDDYLAWRPWDLRPLAAARPRLGLLVAGAERFVNAPHDLKRLLTERGLRRWRREWQSCVERVCELLISGADAGSPQWVAVSAGAHRLANDARLPCAVLSRRMRIPEAFRCQDMAHQDVLTLAHRFAVSSPAPPPSVAVIGARTAGAYFAPLVSAFLSGRGWPRCSWFTIRPKDAPSRHEQRQLERLGRNDAHVVVVDDYPDSGSTLALLVGALKRSGVEPARITVLMPCHPVRQGWRPEREAEWADGLAVVRIEHADLHKTRLLSPEAMRPLLEEYFSDFDSARLQSSASVEAINARFTEQAHDGFQVRMKRVFEVQVARRGQALETRRVLAKSVGWGWLGYHGYVIGTRLGGHVPRVVGLRNGLLLSAWIDERSLPDGAPCVTPDRLGSYVACRARQLRLSGDPCFDNPGYRWTAWDDIVRILRGVYGPYLGRLKSRALHERLRPLVSPMPTVVDGRMRPMEWIHAADGVYKVDGEHHNFGGGELDVVDAAYDLAAAFFEHAMSDEQRREAVATYARDSGDVQVGDRLLLYELLHGVATMRAAAEAATRAGESPRREEGNRRYLRARAVLTDRISRLHAELCLQRSAPAWTTRLFFLDVDGVFDWERLGFPHTTPSGVAALDLLKAHGYSVVLNTGRSLEDVRRYCATYGLPGGVAEHGSVFFDAVRDREQPLIDGDGLAQLARCRTAMAGIPTVCADPAYAHSIRAYRYVGRRTASIGADEMTAVLGRSGCDRLECIVRDADTYVVQTGTGKAPGIRAVRQYLGCADQPAAAIGDSDLDVEALESVEFGFAPANCAPSVRALARRGGCRVMRQPLQAGLLAAARDVVQRWPGPAPADRGPARQRAVGATSGTGETEATREIQATGATALLWTLLIAADRPRSRRWLAACNWRAL